MGPNHLKILNLNDCLQMNQMGVQGGHGSHPHPPKKLSLDWGISFLVVEIIHSFSVLSEEKKQAEL